MEQVVFLLYISDILSGLKLCPLCSHICVKKLRHKLYEQHDADNSERIGNTVSDGCQWRLCTVDGNGKSRRTCQSSGYQSDDAWCINIKQVFHPDSRKTGRRNNK